MRETERQTRSHLIAAFERLGINPRGDLGQNFLIDLNLIDLVIREAELDQHDVALEVGAGTGSLTTSLAAYAGRVVSVEYDVNMYQLAGEVVETFPNCRLIHADALHTKNQLNPEVIAAVDAALAAVGERPQLKLIANLPYHVGTPVISNVLASNWPITRMVVTIQLELAQRMIAGPGTSTYGALSVWLQSQCDLKIVRKLPPTVFWPKPQVDSAIVRVVVSPEKQAQIADRAFLHEFLRDIFTQRRKRLRGVVLSLYRPGVTAEQLDEIYSRTGVDPDARAEQLSVQQLVNLSNEIYRATALRPESPGLPPP